MELLSGRIGEDIAYYYSESEQIPSAVGLGVFVEPDGRVSAAGGFLIQTLPPTEEKMADRLIDKIRKIPLVTHFLRQEKTPEDLLAELFSGLAYRTLGRKPLFFRCCYTQDRVEKVLVALGGGRAGEGDSGTGRGRGHLRILPDPLSPYPPTAGRPSPGGPAARGS